MTNIDQNKGRGAGNSDLRDPRFGNAGARPVFVPAAKPKKSVAQTKEVLEHLQQIKQQKKSASVLNNPAFLGAAMKAIYESSDVSVKRGDQTMVVTQLKDDELTAEIKTGQGGPTATEQLRQVDRSAPPLATPDRFEQSDPFSSRSPIAPMQPRSTPGFTHPKTNASNAVDDPLIRSSSVFPIKDILFWISLVLVFFGLAFWISS